jgi:fluoroquinolone resistance protein
MLPEIHEEQTFTRLKTGDPVFRHRQFENCSFINCDLSYANLSKLVFTECKFEGCNLSLAVLLDTGLQDIQFKDCKLSGADFSKSQDFLFAVNFENCILDNAVFYKKKNKRAKFLDCSLTEADFTEADLTDVKFENCNLNRAFFDHTILKNADLCTSYNFIIDPDKNDIKKAKFSAQGLPGLLAKYDIKIV